MRTLIEKKLFELFDSIRAEEALQQKTKRSVYAEIQRHQQPVRLIRFRKLAFVCALVLLLICIAFSGLYFTPRSYIDIDVNPSLVISVNYFDRVIKAEAYNDDGEKILQKAHVRNKTYEQTVHLLMETIIADGYIQKEEDIVSVTLHANDDQKEEHMLDDLKSSVSQTLAFHEVDVAMEVYTVSEDVLNSAHGHHMSPARYMAIAELQSVDSEASFERCAEHSLSNLRNQTKRHGYLERNDEQEVAQNAESDADSYDEEKTETNIKQKQHGCHGHT